MMQKEWRDQLICWWALMRADWHSFRKVLPDRIINFLIWGVTVIGITGYVLPLFGTSASYGAFTAVGVLVSAGVFEGYGRVAELVTDMEHHQPILYYATLPLNSALMIMRIMIGNTIRGILLSLAIFPLAKLLLGSMFDLSHLQLLPFMLMLILANLFYGACTVWLASKIHSILGISNVWMRCVFPFWFLGGFQFSQNALLQAFPRAGLLNFLNPMVYVTEGMRAAVLGQAGFLNIWFCCAMLCLAWILCTWRGIVNMKRRLDLV